MEIWPTRIIAALLLLSFFLLLLLKRNPARIFPSLIKMSLYHPLSSLSPSAPQCGLSEACTYELTGTWLNFVLDTLTWSSTTYLDWKRVQDKKIFPNMICWEESHWRCLDSNRLPRKCYKLFHQNHLKWSTFDDKTSCSCRNFNLTVSKASVPGDRLS